MAEVNKNRSVEDIIKEELYFSDMTPKDLKLVPHKLVLVFKRKSKSSRRDYFGCRIKFHDSLKVDIQLDETDYNVICLDFKEEAAKDNEFVINVPCILTTGNAIDDKKYFRVQLGLGKTIYRNLFLNPGQSRLIKEYDLANDFIWRDKKIDKSLF